MKYVSIPTKKMSCSAKKSSSPVTSPVFRYTLADTAKKCGYPQEVSLTVHRALGREWDTVLFSVVDTTGKFFTTTLNPQNCGTQIINTAVSRAKNRLILVCDCNDWGDQPKKLIAQLLQVAQSI